MKIFFLINAALFINVPAFCQQGTWAKLLNSPVPGINLDDAQLAKCADGNYIISARDSGSYNSINYNEYLLLKINDQGDTLWTTRFGNMAHVFNKQLRASKGTSDSGLVVIYNAREDTMPANLDIYLHIYKFDKNGVLQWNHYYRFYSFMVGLAINEDSAHNIIVEGMMIETFGFGVVLFKLDSAGNTLWYRTYYPDGTQCYNVGSGIFQVYFDYMLVLKLVSDTNGIAFLKTDTAGNILTAKTTITPYNTGYFTSCQLQDQSLLVFGYCGNYPGKLLIEKVDYNANFVWGRYYTNLENYPQNYIYELQDGSLMVVGYLRDAVPGKWSIYQMKLDAVGNVLWAKNIPLFIKPNSLYFRAAQTSDMGNLLVVEYDDTGMTPPTGTLIIKTDSMGNSCLGGNPMSITSVPFYSYDSTLTYTEMFYQYDSPLQTIPLDAGCITSDYCSTTGMENSDPINISMNLYPNPASAHLVLSLTTGEVHPEEITIYNTLGKIQHYESFKDDRNFPEGKFEKEITVKHFSPGIYFLSLVTQEGIILKKFAKE